MSGKEIYYQQFNEGLPQAGNDQTGSAATPFDALIQRQRLNVSDINAYCLQWSDLKTETGRGNVPEAMRQMVLHVSNGLDFVLFAHLNLEQQASILREFQGYREAEGMEHFALSYEEGKILR